jgi:hypothetical protein
MTDQTAKTPNPAENLPKFKSQTAMKYLAADPETREAEDGSGEKKREQFIAYLERVRQQRASFLTARERTMLRGFTVERNAATGKLDIYEGKDVVASVDENGVAAPMKYPAGAKENAEHNAAALIRSLAVYKAAFTHDSVVLGSVDPVERMMAAKVASLMGVRVLNPPEKSLDDYDYKLSMQIERVCDRMQMRAPQMRAAPQLGQSFTPIHGRNSSPPLTSTGVQSDAPRVMPG